MPSLTVTRLCLAACLMPLTGLPLMSTQAAHAAQDPGQADGGPTDAILVLDASGSMWGRIDDVPKIQVARDVLDGLLDSLPAERRLGMIAYGHRREGDCGDIEQIAALSTDRAALRSAMEGLNPQGKTPLSDAVRRGAEALDYENRRAVVILLSDGKETCDADPCATGQALEKAGFDFTTHVIGFDVAREEEAGLICLAEATGGQYWTAANAQELAAALEETVVKEPPIEGGLKTALPLQARALENGPMVDYGLRWEIKPAGSDAVAYREAEAGPIEPRLAPGTYDIFVEDPINNLTGSLQNVTVGEERGAVLTVVLKAEFEASLSLAPGDRAPAGAEISVTWEGPDRRGDLIAIADRDAQVSRFKDYQYTSRGNPLSLRLPREPGLYEVRYILNDPPTVLARAPVTATALSARISGPEQASAGATVPVAWEGPSLPGDFLAVALEGSPAGQFVSFSYVRDGNPVDLTLPAVAGSYELRYVNGQSQEVAARQPIAIAPIQGAVTVAETAPAGSIVQVTWNGPAYEGDYLDVVAANTPGVRSSRVFTANGGSPLDVQLPIRPGTYEIRYVLGRSGAVLAADDITVTDISATLNAPAAGRAGGEIEITWSGPALPGDRIVITEFGAPLRRAETSVPVAADEDEDNGEGGTITLPLPVRAGLYEIRYLTGNGTRILARREIDVQ